MQTRTIVAKTPAALAQALGLCGLESQKWQVQYSLLKRLRAIVDSEGLTHAEVARRGGSSTVCDRSPSTAGWSARMIDGTPRTPCTNR